jgi:hypothetical protein
MFSSTTLPLLGSRSQNEACVSLRAPKRAILAELALAQDRLEKGSQEPCQQVQEDDCSFSGLAELAQARCNASMFFHRLIAWFRPTRLLPPRKAPEPVGNRTALDLDEFGRLLSTGKAEDLKKIARDLGRQETVPEARH